MRRKRLHPKIYRNTPLAAKVFMAMDPAVADDTIILYKTMRDLEGKIKLMTLINPKYENT